jgi:hypothetical protein
MNPASDITPFRTATLMACLLAITAAAYWAGLQGPFLLDDNANLQSIPQWLDGQLGLASLVFERGAGTLGRPLSMASFALSAWFAGYTPYSMKMGNMLVHLACGLALYGYLNRLLALDSTLARSSRRYALAIAALWLLHPLQASTVLYAVQRMAQLSTLFVLLGLWLYVAARIRLQDNPSCKACVAALLLGVPVLTLLAFLSKENGALLPLLCAVLELVWFQRATQPAAARFFVAAYAALPVLAGLAYLATHPGRVNYARRDFTLVERLLSQPRALCDYLGKLLAPNPPRMGIYTDDFAVSTSLTSPPTTWLALLAIILLTVMAWRLRKRLPAVSFGWFFFLVAHSMEAGPIPLELYFEHRNYLPSVGILLAATALAVGLGRRLAASGISLERIGPLLLGCALLMLAIQTHGRALVWQDATLIAESSLLAHPHSLRANTAVMDAALARGDGTRAYQAIDNILGSANARDRALGHAFKLVVDCLAGRPADIADLEAFVDETPMPLTKYEHVPPSQLYRVMGQQRCPPLTDERIGRSLVRLADRAQAHGSFAGAMRFSAAQFLVRGGALQEAVVQGRLAWTPKSSPAAARPLLEALVRTGNFEEAQHVLDEAKARSDASNSVEQAGLQWWETHIAQARSAMPPPPAGTSSSSPTQ